MAHFTWSNPDGGDWSVASNWSPSIPDPPPGAGDTASLDNLANNYTVTVAAGTTVGTVTGAPFIEINVTQLLGAPALSISGSLTADVIYHTDPGDPATNVTIKSGGSLSSPSFSFRWTFPRR